MGKTKLSFCAALAFAILLVLASPVCSQDQDTTTTPAGSDEMQAPTSSEVETAPEENKTPPATHQPAKKKKHTAHHKHAKKKKARKAPAKKRHAKKPVKKAHPVHHRKPVKKAEPEKSKSNEQKSLPPTKTENEDMKPMPLAPVKEEAKKDQSEETAKEQTATETTKPQSLPKKALAASKKAVAAVASVFKRSPKEKTASGPNGGGRTVTYTFCLGYENCVPHRYEAVMHDGAVDAKVFKETSDRDWTETRLDPVMVSDLGTMARTETGSDISRPLTVTEKARIADHQGKVHVDLVSAANDGNKEQVKQMLRDLNIKNSNDLESYDPRLAKNDVAMQAANELSTGR